MNSSSRLGWRCLRCQFTSSTPKITSRQRISSQWPLRTQQRRHQSTNPADQPGFRSMVDDPPVLVRVGRKHHGAGIIILALIPLTAFALGTWQVQRLSWKTDLIAKYEDRLTRPPLPLPPRVDPETAAREFDYRRVLVKGKWRHDEEMLVGPRLMDGEDGYIVITPLERGKDASTILVSRGWIAKKFRDQSTRSQDGEALPKGEVLVEGLLREPYKKNMFTPANNLEKREFYFPDIKEMAELTGAQPVWVEETMEEEMMETMRRTGKGVPVGRAPEVSLRNNHAQYIFTWYSLSLATSVMLWMVLKKKPSSITQRVTRNREW